jgi:Tol biopolymer transport system component
MKPERWAQIDRLMDEALALAPAEREAFLNEACAGDDELRREVASLLAAHLEAEGFLGTPALEVAAKNLAGEKSSSLLGRTIGPYQIISLLGVGGMGEVYLARDERLERKLAIKFLPRHFMHDPERVRRFAREARAASATNHPNIITIYEIGQADNLHFIATEYVDGETLRHLIGGGPATLKEALGIAIQISGALAAAHQAGVIHRDIKPENVMVRHDGYAKVLDFGLVKLTEPRSGRRVTTDPKDPARTNPGVVLGTVSYMSPEQALGREVDSRTDIFSLGVVLYELVTGGLPFKGDSTATLLDAIVHHAPLAATSVNPQLPLELERIINRALEKDRELRYQTANDLGAELKLLQRELDSSPSRGVSTSQRRLPVPRIHGWAFKAILALAALMVAVTVWLALSRRSAPPKQPPSPWNTAFSTHITDYPGQEMFPSLAPDGKSIVYARREKNQWDIYWQRIGGGNPRNLTEGQSGNDTHPAFSPDGERIAFRSDRDGGGIFIMGATGELVRRVSEVGLYYHPAWSPDGKEVIYTEESITNPLDRVLRPRRLTAVNITTLARRVISTEDIAQPQWSPGGYRIAYWSTTRGGQRDIWTIPAGGGEPVHVTDDEATDWNPVWSPDGKYLYFASDRNGGMRLWRVAIDEVSGKGLGTPELVPTPSAYSQHISLSRDGQRLAFAQVTARYGIERHAFDPVRGIITGQPAPLVQSARALGNHHISPDGSLLAYSSVDGSREEIYVIKSDGTGQPRQLTDEASKKRAPRWSPDGKQIAFYCDRTGAWEIWTVNVDGSEWRQLTFTGVGGTAAFYPIWSPDGARLLYTTRNGRLFIIETANPGPQQVPQPVLPPSDPLPVFWARDWSPDGQKLAGGWRDAAGQPLYVIAFDLTTRQLERLVDGGEQVAWLNDNRRLLFHQEGRIRLVDSQTKRIYDVLSNLPREISNCVLSPDNRALYYSTQTTEADIWVVSQK